MSKKVSTVNGFLLYTLYILYTRKFCFVLYLLYFCTITFLHSKLYNFWLQVTSVVIKFFRFLV